MAKSKSKSKSKTSGNTSDKENEGDHCSWTLDDDKILLDVLQEQSWTSVWEWMEAPGMDCCGPSTQKPW